MKSEMTSEMTSDDKCYYLKANLNAFENDKLIVSKKCDEKIPRTSYNSSLNLFKTGSVDQEKTVHANYSPPESFVRTLNGS